MKLFEIEVGNRLNGNVRVGIFTDEQEANQVLDHIQKLIDAEYPGIYPIDRPYYSNFDFVIMDVIKTDTLEEFLRDD